MNVLPGEWIERVTAILDAGRAGTRAITKTARGACRLDGFVSSEFLFWDLFRHFSDFLGF